MHVGPPFPVPAKDTEAQGTGFRHWKREPLNLSPAFPPSTSSLTLRVWVPTSGWTRARNPCTVLGVTKCRKDALLWLSPNLEFTQKQITFFIPSCLWTLWLLFLVGGRYSHWGSTWILVGWRGVGKRGAGSKGYAGDTDSNREKKKAVVSPGCQAEWLPPRQSWFLSEQMVQLSSHHRSQPPQCSDVWFPGNKVLFGNHYHLQLFYCVNQIKMDPSWTF